ncbi:MAG: hypothetical protein SFY92_12105 [Verrucomicrobiae bacterium]|nr:hypothetical protein [Verrucomicrobiae bacterium]
MKPFLLPTLLLTGLLTACSTPETRIKEHQDTYQKLPSKFQQLVAKGKIAEGMSEDAVYLALGTADQIIDKNDGGVASQIWIYTDTYYQDVPSWNTSYIQTRNGAIVPIQSYQPIAVPHSVPRYKLTFVDKKLVSWEKTQ